FVAGCLAHPEDGWWKPNSVSAGGDGTVPLDSSLYQFQSDNRVTIVRVQGPDHTGLVSNRDSQLRILDILGHQLAPDQISQSGLCIIQCLWNATRAAYLNDPVRTGFLVDDGGRRLGYSPETGPIAEIPNSMWLGQADGLGFVFGPVAPLQLQLTGRGDNYYATVDEVQDGQFGGVTSSGFLDDGQQINLPIT